MVVDAGLIVFIVILIFIIRGGVVVQGVLTQWHGVVRLRFASLTMTVFCYGRRAGALVPLDDCLLRHFFLRDAAT